MGQFLLNQIPFISQGCNFLDLVLLVSFEGGVGILKLNVDVLQELQLLLGVIVACVLRKNLARIKHRHFDFVVFSVLLEEVGVRDLTGWHDIKDHGELNSQL